MKNTDDAEIKLYLEAHPNQEWRSVEEVLARHRSTLSQYLKDHEPTPAHGFIFSLNRRRFLELMSSGLALAGLSACVRQPPERIISRVFAKDDQDLLSNSQTSELTFATTRPVGRFGMGLLATSFQNRPIKLDGRPDDALTLGALDAQSQASLLDVYGTDRLQEPQHHPRAAGGNSAPTLPAIARSATWPEFYSWWKNQTEQLGEGAGLRIVTPTLNSPSQHAALQHLLAKYPKAKWVMYQPLNQDQERAGNQIAFGRSVEARWDLQKAEMLLTLDCDFFSDPEFGLKDARAFAKRRDPQSMGQGKSPLRLFAIESTPGLTGAVADETLSLNPQQMATYVQALGLQIGVPLPTPPALGTAELTLPHARDASDSAVLQKAKAMAQLLLEYRGKCLVRAGAAQPAWIHAVVAALNFKLGNVGTTLWYEQPRLDQDSPQTTALANLVQEMRQGKVKTLILIETNLVYQAPIDFRLTEALKGVESVIQFTNERNETSAFSHWCLPALHYLESWGDTLSLEDKINLIQPLISPLAKGISRLQLLRALVETGREFRSRFGSSFLAGEASK